MSELSEVCPQCLGDGDFESVDGWGPCEWCGGTGLVKAPEPEEEDASVPPDRKGSQ